MRLTALLAISVLTFAGSAAMADVNCTALANPQARRECLQHKYDDTPDCAKLANPQARRECAEYKVDNGNGGNVECSKLATPQARQQCAKQKAK
jgi:hypothetical protein